MSSLPAESDRTKRQGPCAEFHFLGCVPWEDVWALQRRLIYELSGEPQPRLVVLLCEHPETITVGRDGSRIHVRMTDDELRREGIAVRWVSRGGGCVLHAPGQLCVYPLSRLEACGWTVGDYLHRLHTGLCAALETLSIHAAAREDLPGIWGRSGLLAAVGLHVQQGVSCQGAFLNVSPHLSRFARIDTVPPGCGVRTSMSCLLAERRLAVRMAGVRAMLVECLAASFSCSRFHLHTGHVLLRRPGETAREIIARAS